MILDTGCPHNVAGKMWADCFVVSLDERMAAKVKKMHSKNKFKFGCGRILQSLYSLEVPILIAEEKSMLQFDVVQSHLPLLLKKQTKKRWNLTIRTGDDSAQLTTDGKVKKMLLFTSRKWSLVCQYSALFFCGCNECSVFGQWSDKR